MNLLVGFATVLLAISFLPAFAAPPLAANVPVNELQPSFDGWQGTDLDTDWIFLGKTAFGQIAHRRYARAGAVVDLFVGQAGSSARVRSYLSDKAGYPGSGWAVERERAALVAGRAATLRVLRKGATRVLAVAWYEDSPGLAAESARALLSLDTSPVARRSRIPLAVRVSTPLAGAGERAVDLGFARIEGFAQGISPALERLSTPRES
jgi:EpsI family protein